MDAEVMNGLDLLYSEEGTAAVKEAITIQKAAMDLQKANFELLQAADELKERQVNRELDIFQKVLGIINTTKKNVVEEQKEMSNMTSDFISKYNTLTSDERSEFQKTFDSLKTTG
ncbi:hypothetical protein MUO66_02675 [Candidatus Bathyarchaeota archaeon]|nr:hypothetical protein [Candidatus Bathyarchaeota archaeon]